MARAYSLDLRERVVAAKRKRSEAALIEQALESPVPVPLRLTGGGFDLIAEIKLRSPAVGALKPVDESIDKRAVAYATAGAAAVYPTGTPLETLVASLRALSGAD